jgi:hypothetical protein
VASKDLGQLGAAQSQPVMYDWKLYYQIPNLILWLILFGCFLLKENRNWRAWLVLLPLAAVFAMWGMLKQVLPSSSSINNPFSLILSTLAIAVAILWLMSHRLLLRRGIAMFSWSLAGLLIIGLISVYSFCGLNFSNEPMSILILYVAWAVSLLLGLLIARYFCRKKCGGVSFALSLLLWMIVTFDAAMFFCMLLMLAMQGILSHNIDSIFIQVPLVGTVMAVVFYIFTLPYIILTFKCEFYRRRFFACLRLPEPENRTEISSPPDMPEKF